MTATRLCYSPSPSHPPSLLHPPKTTTPASASFAPAPAPKRLRRRLKGLNSPRVPSPDGPGQSNDDRATRSPTGSAERCRRCIRRVLLLWSNGGLVRRATTHPCFVTGAGRRGHWGSYARSPDGRHPLLLLSRPRDRDAWKSVSGPSKTIPKINE